MAKPTANFAEILNMAPSEAKPPAQVPVGSYLCVVQGMPRYDVSSQKGTPFAEYTFSILAAGEDVEEADIAAMEGGVVGKTIKNQYYLTENSMFMLKDFLGHCGLDVDGAGSFKELVDQANGCQIIVAIKRQASKDPNDKRTFSRVAGTAPVEG